MPPQNGPQITSKKETQVIFLDSEGNPIVELGNTQYTSKDSQGTLLHGNTSESLELDGLFYNPTMSMGSQGVKVFRCAICAKKNHGMITNAKICSRCGDIFCSRHRKLIDNKWFCRSCARKYKFGKFFGWIVRSIFFDKEGE